MSRLIRDVREVAESALGRGEGIVAVLRVMLPRKAETAYMLFGAVGGAISSALERRSKQDGHPVSFELAPLMVLVFTGQRVMVWSMLGLFRAKPKKHLGDIPMSVVDEVRFSMRSGKLSFWLSGGPTFELEVSDKSAGRAFADRLQER